MHSDINTLAQQGFFILALKKPHDVSRQAAFFFIANAVLGPSPTGSSG